MKKLFSYDGKVMDLITKFGELVMVGVAFLICCIPIFTIGTSITSLYYSVIKSVRRERGNPLFEFFSSFKRTFLKGSILTLEIIFLGGIFVLGYRQTAMSGTSFDRYMKLLYAVMLVLLVFISVYIFPVLSRFEIKLSNIWKIAFVMSIRYFYFTLLIVAVAVILGYVFIFILPLPTVLFLPGVMTYLSTFIMEKVLLAYMPKPEEGSDAWYYEKSGKTGKEKE